MICAICPSDLPPSPPPAPRRIRAQRVQSEGGTQRTAPLPTPPTSLRTPRTAGGERSPTTAPRALPSLPQQGSILPPSYSPAAPRPPVSPQTPPRRPLLSPRRKTPPQGTPAGGARRSSALLGSLPGTPPLGAGGVPTRAVRRGRRGEAAAEL